MRDRALKCTPALKTIDYTSIATGTWHVACQAAAHLHGHSLERVVHAEQGDGEGGDEQEAWRRGEPVRRSWRRGECPVRALSNKNLYIVQIGHRRIEKHVDGGLVRVNASTGLLIIFRCKCFVVTRKQGAQC